MVGTESVVIPIVKKTERTRVMEGFAYCHRREKRRRPRAWTLAAHTLLPQARMTLSTSDATLSRDIRKTETTAQQGRDPDGNLFRSSGKGVFQHEYAQS